MVNEALQASDKLAEEGIKVLLAAQKDVLGIE